ncbi:ketopantoate reductase family protein [Alteromonas sp. a30]|uniref:ketopantoate reductase family protein n=1 Tax=Alteromonas sp. a30 TaxID=2730917 RepID=UPI002282BE78|nr:2-dehydropantoate 2-reductase [Alteromonas sp. a30]MCY7296587.1 2-dehydropantoate 2-reductase [Alteromonas sp. a30]
MHLGILGNGAIGSLLAAKCHVSGFQFTLLSRQPHINTMQYQFADGQKGSFTPEYLGPVFDTQFDILLVATKAYDVEAALEQWKNTISEDTIIVLMNNGMGPHENIADMFPGNPVVAVLTSYGAYRPEFNIVEETGTGNSAGGWLVAPEKFKEKAILTQLEKLFDAVMAPFTWHEDVRLPLWQKLAINAVINPLTALYKVPNGKLATPRYQSLMTHLIDELRLVMNAEGVHITSSTLSNIINSVVAGTAQNISSMHQDVLRGRKTEIDMITGYLLKVGKRHNIALPHHQRIYEKIKALESEAEVS